ncbi:hypothetical protein B0O99DRAFT_527012 [Bisporella sp. PMI_857]|nr:hypothetical protein B0O99DRAFT_527012 [Bisporella sp. PMI_857]
MKLTAFTLATFKLASIANAHMRLKEPAPYPDQNDQNGPLAVDGSDYPCKNSTYTGGSATQMAIGSTQQLSTIGSATHGGGSCQLSITYDAKPDKSSVFKVIHSIIGGCPIINNTGNTRDDAAITAKDKYSYIIPKGLPTGSATLAWTWFNKVGNREMYMNCAPIEIVASSLKRINSDDLPNMFKANIKIEGSGFPEMTESLNGADLVFPNPGDSVAKPQVATMFNPKLPTETRILAANGGLGSRSGSGPRPSPTSLSIAAPVEYTSSVSLVQTATSTVPGGVFIAASTPSLSGASSNSLTTAGSACFVEGAWICTDGSSFQRCASGVWSAVQQLSVGTKCTVGISDSIAITTITTQPKRAIRFSYEHFKRHFHAS